MFLLVVVQQAWLKVVIVQLLMSVYQTIVLHPIIANLLAIKLNHQVLHMLMDVIVKLRLTVVLILVLVVHANQTVEESLIWLILAIAL